MRFGETNEDTRGRVTILADGVPCAEYDPVHNGARLSCWIPVKVNQTMKIRCDFKTQAKKCQVDVIVDGILRQTVVHTTQSRNTTIKELFSTGYYRKYSEPFSRAELLIGDLKEFSNFSNGTESPLGTIEVQIYKSDLDSGVEQTCSKVQDFNRLERPDFPTICRVGPNPEFQMKYYTSLCAAESSLTYIASFKFRYRMLTVMTTDTLRAAGILLDRPSPVEEVLDSITAPSAVSQTPHPPNLNPNPVQVTEEVEEQVVSGGSGDGQSLDITPAIQNSIAGGHRQRHIASAKRSVEPVQLKRERTEERTVGECIQANDVKREPQNEARLVDRFSISDLDLASDRFKLIRTSSPGSTASEGSPLTNSALTRTTTSTDR
ncbi:MAG: hypothetical protein M1812_000560 [Candelaria pacifica]|nr:MAG: hypothetical protein M1812_000560 [Candelaria pacifica]